MGDGAVDPFKPIRALAWVLIQLNKTKGTLKGDSRSIIPEQFVSAPLSKCHKLFFLLYSLMNRIVLAIKCVMEAIVLFEEKDSSDEE